MDEFIKIRCAETPEKVVGTISLDQDQGWELTLSTHYSYDITVDVNRYYNADSGYFEPTIYSSQEDHYNWNDVVGFDPQIPPEIQTVEYEEDSVLDAFDFMTRNL